jgi:hypothetical protein
LKANKSKDKNLQIYSDMFNGGNQAKIFFKALIKNKTLKKLNIGNNIKDDIILIPIFSILAQNNSLESLDITYNEIRDDFGWLVTIEFIWDIWDLFKKNKIIKSLDLRSNGISDEGLWKIKYFDKKSGSVTTIYYNESGRRYSVSFQKERDCLKETKNLLLSNKTEYDEPIDSRKCEIF